MEDEVAAVSQYLLRWGEFYGTTGGGGKKIGTRRVRACMLISVWMTWGLTILGKTYQ